jgi:hypothetical protein
MADTATHKLGPPAQLTEEHEDRRRRIDARARERIDALPQWAVGELDRALRERLLRDDDLPASSFDLCEFLDAHGWMLSELRYLLGVGLVDRREISKMTFSGREFLARLAREAGPDLARRIDELRAEVSNRAQTIESS